MALPNQFKSILLATAFAVMNIANAHAQSTDPAWLEDLALDLATDHECGISEYLSIQEGKVGGRNFYTAKVKCVDGRTFDASRIEPAEEFTIRLCEVVLC